MKVIYLLLLFAYLLYAEKNTENEEHKCEGIHVRGKFHRKEVLARGLNRPYHLTIYIPEHRIYFSYNVGNDEEDKFKIGYVEKNVTGHKAVEEVENGFATAIDHNTHTIFFGGSQGVYKHQLNKNSSKIVKIVSNHNVWDMFYKHVLYFVNFPSQRLYKYDPHKPGSKAVHQAHIHEKIYQFVIDGDDDRFFTNDTGLYKIKNGTEDRIFYKGPSVFRAIELNNKGEAYFSGKHAIYVANKTHHKLEEIAHIKNIFGITFDAHDNIIYSDPHEIVRLLPEECT